jgi:hypothetical protein
MASTDEGIRTDRSDEQFENADFPRFEVLHPAVKVTAVRFTQSLKQVSEMFSIDERIQIDRSDEHWANADSSIMEVFPPNSNAQ